MRLGIGLPFRQPDDSAPGIAQVAARAQAIERVGFDGIWLGDTIGRGTGPRPDTLAWLLAAGAATRRLELGTAVIQVPLRNPVELAQRLLTMRALLGERFFAGLGAGSTQQDFDAVGVNFLRRFKLLEEGIRTIQRLSEGQQVGEANLHPWPNTLGGPPILIGSWHSGRWVRKAAQEHAGWMASGRGTPVRALREGIERFRAAGGKRAMVVTVDVNLAGPDRSLAEEEPFNLNCAPKEARARLRRVAELGYDDVCLVRLGHSEADLPEDELKRIRDLA